MQQAHMQPQNEPQAETKKKCLTDLTLPKLTDYIKSIVQPPSSAAASSPKTVRSNICFSLRTATALKRF